MLHGLQEHSINEVIVLSVGHRMETKRKQYVRSLTCSVLVGS